MFNRIKSLLAIKSPSVFDKIILSVAILGTVALVIGTS